MKGNQQSDRLTTQQKATEGVIGIFDSDAQQHDKKVSDNSKIAMSKLQEEYPAQKSDGSNYTLHYDNGILNRLDRLTAANYGMKINTNLCKNKFIFW